MHDLYYSFSSRAALIDDIKAVNKKFEDLFAKQDAKALSELFTEDCKLLPPGSPDAVVGREGSYIIPSSA